MCCGSDDGTVKVCVCVVAVMMVLSRCVCVCVCSGSVDGTGDQAGSAHSKSIFLLIPAKLLFPLLFRLGLIKVMLSMLVVQFSLIKSDQLLCVPHLQSS